MNAGPGILCLDTATTTGWAFARGHETPLFGTFTLPSCGENYGVFAAEFWRWLAGRIVRHEPRLVVYEKPIHLPTDKLHTVRRLYSLATVIEMVCFTKGIRVESYGLDEIRTNFVGPLHRKRFPGRDNIKRAVIAECRARGWNPNGDDDADALALLDLARVKHMPGYRSRTHLGLGCAATAAIAGAAA
jgi:hypothetical protein